MKKFVFTFASIFVTVVVSVTSISHLHAADEALTEVDSTVQQAVPASLTSLKALVDAGSHKEAYAQSQEMLFDFEGEPEFDLLYGTAALGVGKSTEAIIVFERLVEYDPLNLRYQLDLGRSYYQAGQTEKAKSIFESVLVSDQEIPENVENQVLAYLDAIETGSNFGNPEKQETLKGFIGIAAGYDSNANAASDATEILAYINGFVFPTANGTKKESTNYFAHQIGGAYVKPLGQRSALDLRVLAQKRKNGSDLSHLDQGTVFFEIANRWKFEKGIATFGLRYSGVTLGDDDLYDFTQFSMSWRQPVALEFADVLDFSLSTGAIRYTSPVNEERDIDPSSFTVGLSKKIDKLVHSGNIQYGTDKSQGMDNFVDQNNVVQVIPADHYSRSYVGFGYTLSYLYDDKTTFFGGLNYQKSSYKEEDHDFFNSDGEWTKRDGDMTSLALGSSYNWNKSLQFRANISTTEVTSKIDLYEFSRNKLEVGASYQL